MPLNVAKLEQALAEAFQAGTTASSSADVAAAISQAIHAYLSEAEVKGINVTVAGPTGPLPGVQTAPVRLT